MSWGRILLATGLLVCAAGVLVLAAERFHLLDGLGRLPGDVHLEGKNWRFFFPITTCIVISVLLTVLLNLTRLLGGR